MTAVVVPIALSGDGERATPVSTSDTTTPGSPKERRTPRPEDRDPAAVTAALRQLDPCQLLDLEVAKRRGRPNATPIAVGPHACHLLPSPDSSRVPGELHLEVGTVSDQLLRYRMAPIALGGAKAYEYLTGSGAGCRVAIPVSFVRAIELSVRTNGGAQPCETVRQYAEATVAKLRNPDAVAYRDTVRPFAGWDGCTLLRELLGEHAGGYETHKPDGLHDPFGGCGALGKTKTDHAFLEISYAAPAELVGNVRQIAGRPVGLSASEEECAASWNHGPSGNQNPWYATAVVTLDVSKDCDTTAAMVERAIALADQRPEAGNTKPQRPLLFGPEDNDTGSPGACVDYQGGGKDCEPYQQVPVPKDPGAIMAAGQADRHVQCAVFKEAVEARFGGQFAPVTWGAHCFFVDQEHTVEINVNVDPANAPADYGAAPSSEETRIAGRAAVTFWHTDRTTFEIYLSPYDDLDQLGNLHVAVESIGGRGKEVVDAPPLPQRTADLATDVMAQVVETYFR